MPGINPLDDGTTPVETVARSDAYPAGHFYISHLASWPFAIQRSPLLDPELSFETKGVYAELCAIADKHDGVIYESMAHMPQSCIDQLIAFGYIGK